MTAMLTTPRHPTIDPVHDGHDDGLESLWDGPEPDPDPTHVDHVLINKVFNPDRHGNTDAWRYLTPAERDELVRQAVTRQAPLSVTWIARLLHCSNDAVKQVLARLQLKGDHMPPVLTVRRPWAGLIVAGVKPVEIRKWTTNHRGPVLIAAGLRWETHAVDLADRLGVAVDVASTHPVGIVGRVNLVGMCDSNPATCVCGPWAYRAGWHWQLADAEEFPRALPWTGTLGLRWPTADMAELIEGARRG